MTLVYKRDADGGPALHAFVVGCGHYPYLPVEMNADRQSCPDSTRAFVEFLVGQADNFRAKLASIEVLISDPNGDNTVGTFAPFDPRANATVDTATSTNVRKAGADWMARCNDGDYLLFYGCAHGVTDRDDTALMLLEDVWNNVGARWEESLNVASMSKYLPAATKAAACWIFLDACQELRDDIIEEIGGVTGIQIAKANVRQLREARDRSVSLAAAPYGEFAQAPRRGVAEFTQALLEGLKYCCVESTANGWEVSSDVLLKRGVVKRIGWVRFGYQLEPVLLNIPPASNHFLLKVEKPRLPLMITTVPETLMTSATNVQVTCGNGPAEVRAADENKTAWRLQVPLGTTPVTVEAVLDGPKTVQQQITLQPPYHIVELQ